MVLQLFDTLNTAQQRSTDNETQLLNRVGTAQDVLGQSLNTATVTTMTELANISKLIPWLEHCRQVGADKTQAREEKWRTSSANFHDQSRRDRESAEKRIEEELQRQKALLIRIAEANGIDVEDDKDRSREVSLGAQLTAELSLEASRAENGHGKAGQPPPETITVDEEDNGVT